MCVQVIEVNTNIMLKKFLELPNQIYKEDPLGVRPSMDHTLNSYFLRPNLHRNIKLFLAIRENKPAARVAAIIDPYYPADTGFFGFFEAFDDLEAAGKVFTTAFNWLTKRGIRKVLGPVTYNTNQLIGILIEGFSEEPYFMTPYNPPYYSLLLNNLGFDKAEDFYAYKWHSNDKTPSKIIKVAQRARRITGLKIRSINFRKPGQEANIISSILNQAMADNWGYRPLSYRDARQVIHDYRSYADPELITVIEIQDKPAGICLVVPNINPLLREHPQGLPLPLPQTFRKKLNTCRLAILGVIPDFRCRGVEALMMVHSIETAKAKGYTEAELSLIHEKNTMMNKIITETIGTPKSKSFRLYQKDI
ncbi:GNAT family N-acetyltransferase [Desulfolucanica intricata]|uniref:GNAT family N-acetyltransferase n=1 Tax=Desulfolucanica intricata TaxID=1285191 RepID=UPI0008343655|nr:GNAT family N-acetyltransferase [Desulfolucanica intricata]